MNSQENNQKHKSTKQGVIAVLFLFVVAFVIGAISLSMQTGQVIERRVLADQAADSGVYAFAAKSAQGLNFIAANNLAIAGSSHMIGVLHIASDWAIVLTALFKSKSAVTDPDLVFNKDDYQKYYNIMQPIAKMYLRSGVGLTRTNSAIKKIFPYLGLVDAITTAGANSPSSLVIPFRTPPGQQNAGQSGGGNALKEIGKKITTNIRGLLPTYEGLTAIHSDETFCLAYRAGEQALGSDWHKVGGWFNSSTFPGALAPIVEVIDVVLGAVNVVGALANFVTIKVGFQGCGFGATGEPVTGGTSYDYGLIAALFQQILTGPLSGRPATFSFGTTVPPAVVHPTLGDFNALANELDTRYQSYCSQVASIGQWNTAKTTTAFNPKTGVCVYRKHTNSNPRSLPFTPSINALQGPFSQSPSPVMPGYLYMYEYDYACHGTVLFKWNGFAGSTGKIDNANPPNFFPDPSPDTHPEVDTKEQKASLCPSFEANQSKSGERVVHYPRPPNDSNNPYDYAHLSREKSFLVEIIKGLAVTSLDQAPSGWRGDPPRTGAMQEINEYLACAAGLPNSCPFKDTKGGYFENAGSQRFYPELSKLNWMCPTAKAGDPSVGNMRATLKFANPKDPGRWADTIKPQPILSTPEYESKYIEIKEWHNARVNKLVDNMKCDEYERFISKPRKPPSQPTSSPPGADQSNDYCKPGAHICWQKTLQKKLGRALEKGSLSFTVSKKPAPNAKPELDESLHYAILTLTSLRTDNGTDIVGRNDGSDLSHCPQGLDATATLEDGTPVQVCDIQPVVGFISRMLQGQNGAQSARSGTESFGAGDTNLASGGSINTLGSSLGTSDFIAVAQAGVVYEKEIAGDPQRPTPNPSSPTPPSTALNYRLFWPSWKPVVEPSRVFGKMLPPLVTPLVED
jgi:hypothetical protein